jgi:hypothetical protein
VVEWCRVSIGLRYQRGAFVAFEPQGYPDRRRVIPFRFNPESISRSVSLEVGQNRPGTEGAATQSAPAASSASAADPAAGTLKETLSVAIRLDFADREESVSGLDPDLGIAPEIAAIEELLYPAETSADASSDGTEPVKAAKARPTVLFVWGRHRVLPVRIASLKIDESVFNASLHPVRAEIEASLEVLGEADARNDPAVSAALQHTGNSRRDLAQQFYENTSSQSSILPPIP